MLTVLVTILFALAVALAVFSTNGLILVFDASYYSRGEIEQNVQETYGLGQDVLVPVNRAIVRFFSTPSLSLADSFTSEGVPRDFFGERETVHMNDVRGLIALIGLVQRFSLGCVIIIVVASLVILGTKAVEQAGAGLIAGSGLAILLLVVLGALTLVNFSGVFLEFHLLSFTNDDWLLDPRTDHLIQMFPFGFWYNAMVTLVIRSAVTSVGVGLVGGVLLWLGRRLI